MVTFLFVLIELFCRMSRLRRYEQILVEIVGFYLSTLYWGVGHFECNL